MSETATTTVADPASAGTEVAPAPPAVALYEPAPAGPEGRSLPIDALRDVELSVEVILGRARMTLRELLSAQPHTTIELDRPNPEGRQRKEGMIPLRRYGTPEEFGRVAAFCLSPAASYLTGSVVMVDGGISRSL